MRPDGEEKWRKLDAVGVDGAVDKISPSPAAVGGGAIMDLCKLLEVNDSATNMVHAVANLELVLKEKLEFIANNLYYPSTGNCTTTES